MSLLRVEHLSKEFSSVHAVEVLSFQVEAGTVHSIIGPNGAGKTTLFNLITGIYQPSDGHIMFEDHRINNVPPFQLAKRGISRTFQNLQIFFNMSALEKWDGRLPPLIFVGRRVEVDPHGPTASKCQEGRASSSQANRRVRDED